MVTKRIAKGRAPAPNLERPAPATSAPTIHTASLAELNRLVGQVYAKRSPIELAPERIARFARALVREHGPATRTETIAEWAARYGEPLADALSAALEHADAEYAAERRAKRAAVAQGVRDLLGDAPATPVEDEAAAAHEAMKAGFRAQHRGLSKLAAPRPDAGAVA